MRKALPRCLCWLMVRMRELRHMASNRVIRDGDTHPVEMPLTLKPHPFGVDDFDVFDDTRRLGRVYWRAGKLPWRWIISTAMADPPPQGRAATRIRALEEFRTAYQGLNTQKVSRVG